MRPRDRRRRQGGQSMVEFSLAAGALMVLIVAAAQLGIWLHYRSTLQLAAQEGAFTGSLAGHGDADADRTTRDLWASLEPGGGAVQVTVATRGSDVAVTAEASAPAIVPLPFPPYTRMPVKVRATHTIERFRPGSAP